MKKINTVRGTHDLYGEDMKKFRHVVDVFKKTAINFGCEEFRTPIFEFLNVYHRKNDTSDIANKELYILEDRSGEKLALRPEGTAGVSRAIVSNGLQNQLPLKLFYSGQMFRYERPQKGRQREFNQLGLEFIGSDSPLADVEVIALGWELIKQLGISKNTKILINSLGDRESREAYKVALVEYYTKFEQQLSDDSKRRLKTNPLRILDSKEECDRKINANVPKMQDYLNESSKEFYQEVKDKLTLYGIEFEHSDLLVRGLDYYCHTVFEFVNSDLGAQATVIGGGRYSGLIEYFGGQKTECVGFGSGIERLMLSLQKQPKEKPLVSVIPMGDNLLNSAINVVNDLRSNNIAVDIAFSGNMKKRLKRANKINSSFALIIGEEEEKNNTVIAKDFKEGTQEEIKTDSIAKYLLSKF